MNKNVDKVQLFKGLYEAGFTRRDFDEYICYKHNFRLSKEQELAQQAENAGENQSNLIKTSLRLAYWNGNQDAPVELLPYLDLTRKGDIWGIESEHCIVRLKYEKEQTFDEVRLLATNTMLGKYSCDLFTPKQFMACLYRRDEFDKLVKILQKNGVSADPWYVGKWHYTSDCQNQTVTVCRFVGKCECSNSARQRTDVLARLIVEID